MKETKEECPINVTPEFCSAGTCSTCQENAKDATASDVEAIFSLRVEKGMNQFELAKATGYTQSYISQIESGKREITEKAALKFSKVFKMPVEHILNGGYRNYLLKKVDKKLSDLSPKQLEDVRSYIDFLQHKAK